MLETIKELSEKGFGFTITSDPEKEVLLTVFMYPRGKSELCLCAPILENESDNEVVATLKRLEEKLYERGWV